MNLVPRRLLFATLSLLWGVQAFAATHGDTGTGGAAPESLEQAIVCFGFTPAAGEVPTTFTARLQESSNIGAHDVKAVLFLASTGALVETSDTLTDVTLSMASYVFTFTGAGALSNVAYRACLQGSGAAGDLLVDADDSTGSAYGTTGLTWPTTPNPITLTPFTLTPRMFLTTTDPGGASSVVPKILMQH
jgi:hypothetical protein